MQIFTIVIFENETLTETTFGNNGFPFKIGVRSYKPR
jgi:hypothetical protein